MHDASTYAEKGSRNTMLGRDILPCSAGLIGVKKLRHLICHALTAVLTLDAPWKSNEVQTPPKCCRPTPREKEVKCGTRGLEPGLVELLAQVHDTV